MKKTRPISLLVRIAMAGMPLEELIEKHNAIAAYNAVSFGVRGRKPTTSRCATFDDQNRAGIPTYLYIVQRTKDEYRAFRGPMLAIMEGEPFNSTIPSYYADSDMVDSVNFWVSVGELKAVPISVLERLRADTSDSSVLHVLSSSMASVIFVG